MLRSTYRSSCSVSVGLVVLMLSLGGCASMRGSERDTRMAEVQYDLGVTAFQNSQYESAITSLRKAIELDPGYFYAHNALGLVWWKKDKLDEALACFERAVQVKPDFSDAWNNLGALAMQRKDFAKAKTAFEKVLADPIYSTPYVTHANLGWLYHMQGDDKQALEQLREALATDEAYCVAHKFTADIYEESGKKDKAAEEWMAFARSCPQEPEALFHLGQQQLADGDPQSAALSFGECWAYARKISRDHVFIKPCTNASRSLPPLPAQEQLRLQRIAEPSTSIPLPGSRELESTNR